MVRSPSRSTMVPDRTVNQSRPGWTRSRAGTFLVTRSFAIVMPRGAPVRDSSQVVMPRASSRNGLITTSASSSDSTSWSSVVPSALAIGVS